MNVADENFPAMTVKVTGFWDATLSSLP